MSYSYFGRHNIPYKKVGKLIVAQDQAQAKRIDDLYERGLKNNVPELKLIEKNDICKFEPKCKVKFDSKIKLIIKIKCLEFKKNINFFLREKKLYGHRGLE